MENNTRRFNGKVQEYAQYREQYDPTVLLPRLREWCGLEPEWLVADIGAGTGMLSDVFLANGNRVLAVEPNEEMRSMCAELHEGEPRLETIAGTAEATGLVASSVEMVTAGRALHWFDLDRAVEEFRRILKPDGWMASVAFGRSDTGREENVEFERLLRSNTGSEESTHAAYKTYQRLADFLVRDAQQEKIGGTMTLDWEKLQGITLSLSHAPRREDVRYASFMEELRRYFERFAADGVVTWETRYWINVGRLSR